jgi:hypothetical protein
MHRECWLLVIPPCIEFVGDIVLTLWGQPAEYWNGTSSALEANPVGLYLLGLHPGAFLAGAAAYVVLFAVAICRLPERWAFLLSLALLIAHASGINSWLLMHGSLFEGAHNVFAATVAAVCYHTYFLRVSRANVSEVTE